MDSNEHTQTHITHRQRAGDRQPCAHIVKLKLESFQFNLINFGCFCCCWVRSLVISVMESETFAMQCVLCACAVHSVVAISISFCSVILHIIAYLPGENKNKNFINKHSAEREQHKSATSERKTNRLLYMNKEMQQNTHPTEEQKPKKKKTEKEMGREQSFSFEQYKRIE